MRDRLLVSKAARPFVFAAGWLLLALGIAGLVLPLLPGTVFLIGAAACFTRSSPRFENWLLTHPKFGPAVVEWRQSRAIPRRAKAIAVCAMAFSFVLTWLSGPPPFALWTAGIALTAAAIYVLTRPSTRP